MKYTLQPRMIVKRTDTTVLQHPLGFFKPTRALRELNLLTAIDGDPAISQRVLARRAGMSPTMANTYVADFETRGLVRVSGETNRTTRYALTEAGLRLKRELIFASSREVIRFYGQVKAEFHNRLRSIADEGVRRLVLFGAAETGEMAVLAGRGAGLEIVGLVDSDPAKHGREVGGLRVSPPEVIETLRPDAVLITSHGHADAIRERLAPLEGKGIRVLRF